MAITMHFGTYPAVTMYIGGPLEHRY
jgi:hypothetical protein